MGYTLSNGTLTVEIADIGSYRGSRFDWTGFITQVTLEQGRHTFCMPESLIFGAGSGGMGLCNEFGITQAIGYDEVSPGGWFPKPGVGLLQKKSTQSYSFADDYKIEPFSISIQSSSETLAYTVSPLEHNGYSILLTKTISLAHNALHIDYSMENKGAKAFSTEEYVHNFIGIDGNGIGRDYELRLPGMIGVEDAESEYTTGLLQVSGDRLSWAAEPERMFYCRLVAARERAEPDFFWELIHKPSGAGIRESGNFAADRIALWGAGHVVSPEIFVNISLIPGQSKQWRRTYTFFNLL